LLLTESAGIYFGVRGFKTRRNNADARQMVIVGRRDQSVNTKEDLTGDGFWLLIMTGLLKKITAHI
jgi:hypothetical protein